MLCCLAGDVRLGQSRDKEGSLRRLGRRGSGFGVRGRGIVGRVLRK